MKKTVAIVGNGRTRVYAPHGNSRITIWTMNNHAILWQKRTSAVFEMHPDALTTNRYDDEYKNWLRQPHDFPIYMHDTHPEIPASVKYPRREIVSFWGACVQRGSRKIKNFFTTTPPYMLALALYLGYERVEMYGIDLEKEERIQHRDSVFYWMGILGTLGVDIYIPEECTLMDDYIYPLNTPIPEKRKK